MKKYCFGIDIGGTTVKCGLFDVQGNVLDKWEIKTRSEGNGENIIPDVAAAIETKISEKGIEKADIAGIGVGVPGPVNEEGAVVTAVNLHWGYVDLAGEMEKLTGITTKVGNDANVAALGEMWKGGGEGHIVHHQLQTQLLGDGVGHLYVDALEAAVVGGHLIGRKRGIGGHMELALLHGGELGGAALGGLGGLGAGLSRGLSGGFGGLGGLGSGGGRIALVGAGTQRQRHSQRQQQGRNLLHCFHSSFISIKICGGETGLMPRSAPCGRKRDIPFS